jgi:hypothetical protein
VAVYSAGVNNPYGHPHDSTLELLAQVGAQTFGTDTHGTVTITADNDGYRVNAAHPAAPRAPPATPTAIITPTPTTSIVLPLTKTQSLTDSPPPLHVVSLTSPIERGYRATLTVQTTPGAYCTIAVYYKTVQSTAAGLEPKQADATGQVSWTWRVGNRTSPGTWSIRVTSTVGNQTTTQDIPIKVLR